MVQENCLDWWRVHGQAIPHLAAISRQTHCVPASDELQSFAHNVNVLYRRQVSVNSAVWD